MEDGKYDRAIQMLCPTCGGTDFEYDQEIDEPNQIIKCTSCGLDITKEDLIQANSENIEIHKQEIGEETVKDLQKELKDTFKQALKGSKNIRFE